MTATLPDRSQPTQGNAIVKPDAAPISFPMLALAATIVAGGIYLIDQYDSRAAWLMAFLVLLGVAFRYKGFGNEIVGLLGTPALNQQTATPGQLMPGQQGPLPTTLVGPTGPLAV